MANSTTNITVLTQGQASKYATINGLFDASSQSMLGARKDSSAGLTWEYYGGNMFDASGAVVAVANGSLTLTNSATNYIEINQAGTVSANTSAFTSHSTKLYTAVTSGGLVTSYTDHRVNFNSISVYSPVLASTTNSLGTLTANYYGKTLLWSPTGAGSLTLPANGAAAGAWFKVKVLTDQTTTYTAGTADTLITFNDTQADSVEFSTAGQKIGAYIEFMSNGTVWIATNLSTHTMTVNS